MRIDRKFSLESSCAASLIICKSDAELFRVFKQLRKIKVLFLSAITCSIVGCTTDPLKGEYAGYSVEPLKPESVEKQKKTFDDLISALGFKLEDVKNCTAASADDAVCVPLRNSIVSSLVLTSEELCLSHRRSIYGKEATFNITAGTFTNLFAGWAAVAASERGKSILSALALFSNSERSLVNELVYKSVVVVAVDRKIQQMRDIQAEQIKNHFSDSIKAYPIYAAFNDVLAFHRSCSFMTGLERAVTEGIQETPHQKAERLKRDLLVLQSQVNNYKPASAADPVYVALLARYQAMSDEIRTLEKQ